MTTNHQLSDVDAHGATIRATAAAREASIKQSSGMVLAALSGSYMNERMRSGASATSRERHGQHRSWRQS
jgi:hypothetical protein